jgi:CRP-like cAMP-binding protein
MPITTNLTPAGLPFNSLKSYLEESPSMEVQEAITDVTLLSLQKQDLEALVHKSHEFSQLMYRIHENILLDRENRMFLLQYRNPSKRFRLFHENVERSRGLIGCTPDKFLASYLNMTPQQYSREKRTLAQL